MSTYQIISKVWSFCNTLRDDGVGYGDYLEQLTYLLFLKMADEYTRPPYNRTLPIPPVYNWQSLTALRGAELEGHYTVVLRELGKCKGILGQIFTKSQNKIQDPAKLYKLVQMIDAEMWVTMGADVKGDIYEGLLEKNAEDTKSGAGQYFTPRPLIRAMVACVRPEPLKTIVDPACGTGGFFLAAYDFIVAAHKGMDKEQLRFLKFNTFRGNEIVAGTRRLALMNLFLHNIGDIDSDNSISPADALTAPSAGAVRLRTGQPALRQKKQPDLYQSGRRTGKRRPHLQPPGLLGHHLQQATELCAAHPLHAQAHRYGRRGRSR
jgi:type I restriction enzyme M protein